MSRVRQVGLLAAGCQPWNKDVCAASGDRFAYCATLAIYIYQVKFLFNRLHFYLAYFTLNPFNKCFYNAFGSMIATEKMSV